MITTERLSIPGTPAIPGLRFRAFRGVDADVPGMFEARTAALMADGQPYVGQAEGMKALYRHLERCDPETDIAVVELDERIVGYARVEWQDTNDGQRWHIGTCNLDPVVRRRGVGSALLAWSEGRRIANARAQRGSADDPGDRPLWLVTFVDGGSDGARALVERAGYQDFRTFFTMRRPDLEDIPSVELPADLQIRPIPNDRAAMRRVFDADHAAFSEHFGWAEGSDAIFESIMEDPSTDPALWVVAFDGEAVAGAVLNGLHPRPGEPGAIDPWLDSVFTTKAWRRRGVARALIARSLQVLRDLGHDRAYLGVDAENANDALRLYRSSGFEVASTEHAYRRPLDEEVLR